MSSKQDIELQFARRKSAILQCLILVATVSLSGCSHEEVSKSAKAPDATTETTKTTSKSTIAQPQTKPADISDRKKLANLVDSPEKYTGINKMSYLAAKQIPDVLQSLFCYCGCDHADDHTSLLDCFKDDHSASCDFCRGEAVMAFKMVKKGASLCEIQKAVDLNWGRKYPWFEQPSDTIKNYWKTRLWAPGNVPTAAEKHDDKCGIYDPFSETLDKFDKKVHSSSGNCCGGSKEAKAARATKQ